MEIAKLLVELRQGTFSDADGSTRSLREDDFMVVAPYNGQVRRLHAGLPATVRVGTVDKFQGQQASVVFFSMAIFERRKTYCGTSHFFFRVIA